MFQPCSKNALRWPAVTMLLTLLFVATGCSDDKIVAPLPGVDVIYHFHLSSGGPEFGEVVVFLLHEKFRLDDHGSAQNQNKRKYNGCVRINAILSESESEAFRFIIWSQIDDHLLIDLNEPPNFDWTMIIKNDDGGKLDAVITGTTSDGEQHEYLFTGLSPKTEIAEECIQEIIGT